MKKQSNEISYFEMCLRDLIESSYPEWDDDDEFIVARSEMASSVYEEAFLAGHSIEQCIALAEAVLYEGFYFSRYDTIQDILFVEFAEVVEEIEIRVMALKLLPVCNEVFDHYTLTDDFAYSADYDWLHSELIGKISNWLEQDHGI